MRRTVAASAVLIAVTAVLDAGVPQKKPLPFCADGPGVKVPAQLLPVDEASRRPDFFTYRARLQVAVADSDLDVLVAAADPNIRLGFGGEAGRDELRKAMSGADGPGVWKELARILALGGAFRHASSFEAPYVFSQWPDRADAFECAAILGSNVSVRSAASTDAPVVARVSYAIIRTPGEARPVEGWSLVQLANGQQGFVKNEYLGSPNGLRAIFTLTNGQWRMTALVAGD